MPSAERQQHIADTLGEIRLEGEPAQEAQLKRVLARERAGCYSGRAACLLQLGDSVYVLLLALALLLLAAAAGAAPAAAAAAAPAAADATLPPSRSAALR